MAKEGKSGSGGAVSLSPKDATVSAGLFGPGKAKAVKHLFGIFEYSNGVKATALLVDFKRGDEKERKPYTVGQGFKPSKDGKTVIALQGQTGLSAQCNAMRYIKSLSAECGMPETFVSNDITVLDGIEGNLTQMLIDRVVRKDDKNKGKNQKTEPTSILVFDDLTKANWKIKAGAKASDDEEEEEEEEESEEEEEEDEDDSKSDDDDEEKDDDDDDDDDEDESSDDDDDESEFDEDEVEAGSEALITALDDGDLKTGKIEGAVLAILQKSKIPLIKKNAKKIAKMVDSAKFLELEKGWTFNAKKKTVSLEG